MASSAFLRSPPTLVFYHKERTPKFQYVWGKVILTAILVCQRAKRQRGPVALGHVPRPGADACQRSGSNFSAVLEFKDSIMKGGAILHLQYGKSNMLWDAFGVSNVEGGSAGWPRFKSTAMFACRCFGGRFFGFA